MLPLCDMKGRPQSNSSGNPHLCCNGDVEGGRAVGLQADGDVGQLVPRSAAVGRREAQLTFTGPERVGRLGERCRLLQQRHHRPEHLTGGTGDRGVSGRGGLGPIPSKQDRSGAN